MVGSNCLLEGRLDRRQVSRGGRIDSVRMTERTSCSKRESDRSRRAQDRQPKSVLATLGETRATSTRITKWRALGDGVARGDDCHFTTAGRWSCCLTTMTSRKRIASDGRRRSHIQSAGGEHHSVTKRSDRKAVSDKARWKR